MDCASQLAAERHLLTRFFPHLIAFGQVREFGRDRVTP